MGGIAPSRYGCTIRTQNKSVKFFFNFFFVGCGRVGVGAWVWARGCGRVGVGAWVWARGCGCSGARVWVRGCGCVGGGAWVGARGGRDGDGRALDEAGWIGIVAVGWARIASMGLPNPNSDCWLGCDR